MSKRTILSVTLGLFLLVSLAVAVLRPPGRVSAPQDDQVAAPTVTESDAAHTSTAPTAMPVASEVPAVAEARSHVVAYYFHVTQRCVTCATIEQYAFEALNTYFSPQIEEGTLELLSVDVQQPENAHYIRDFELEFQTLVVARYDDDRLDTWKNLADVWQLVQDKERFFLYVKTETDAIVQEAS